MWAGGWRGVCMCAWCVVIGGRWQAGRDPSPAACHFPGGVALQATGSSSPGEGSTLYGVSSIGKDHPSKRRQGAFGGRACCLALPAGWQRPQPPQASPARKKHRLRRLNLAAPEKEGEALALAACVVGASRRVMLAVQRDANLRGTPLRVHARDGLGVVHLGLHSGHSGHSACRTHRSWEACKQQGWFCSGACVPLEKAHAAQRPTRSACRRQAAACIAPHSPRARHPARRGRPAPCCSCCGTPGRRGG